ncbi:hypothetical protein GIW25_23515 [Pseudomonas syringae]|nr:hypothetical protein [Pseudomonas syringae]
MISSTLERNPESVDTPGFSDRADHLISPWLRFRPDFVGFLRPVTDPGVAATRHPWRGAASLASCQANPGSVPGLSRHLRRNLRRQCHRG